MLFDDDNERLGLVAEYEHPIVGRMRQFGELIDFSETPGHIARTAAARRRAHREHPRRLGYDDAQMQALRDEGTVYWPDANFANYPWTV